MSLRFELSSLPTFFAAAKKVGAAPHRGNANRPTRNQGKANTLRTKKKREGKENTTTKQNPAPRAQKKATRCAANKQLLLPQ
ncbi:hypothetical protein [Paraburkholderia youngii]|uniref:hypothetical protein n=1 Tax=Paraburkholderia youngii TaxID=2782701 RepID=UPI003D247B19